MEYERWKAALAGRPLPAALVDLDAFDRNLAALLAMVPEGGPAVRIATKSIRVPALIRRALDASPRLRGLMCFCAPEAALLAEQGFDDLLVAYPTVQDSDLHALRRLHEAGTRVLLVVDSIEGVTALARAMAGVAVPFPAVVELDVAWRPAGGRLHIGARRSPVRSATQLRQLLREAAVHADAVRVAGVMGYEAQVAGVPDANPFKRWMNPALRVVRRRSMRAVRALREQVPQVFTEAGLELELFNGGGTGSLAWAAGEPWLTEVTAGSGLLCSHLFDYYSNFHLEPAAVFALQVVRASDPGYVTCQGGGYVASGEPGWDRVPAPYLPAGLRLVSTEGAGEVQTPLRVPRGVTLRPGDPVLLRHAKAGELAERFAEYLLVSDGTVIDVAPTYRGLGATFP